TGSWLVGAAETAYGAVTYFYAFGALTISGDDNANTIVVGADNNSVFIWDGTSSTFVVDESNNQVTPGDVDVIGIEGHDQDDSIDISSVTSANGWATTNTTLRGQDGDDIISGSGAADWIVGGLNSDCLL